jgi:hypothetical protein
MITHVAIRFQGVLYSLPSPNRHHDVIRFIVERLGVKHVDARDEDQGFLDDQGRYLTRRRALVVARESGQLWPDRPILHGMLFSENVW